MWNSKTTLIGMWMIALASPSMLVSAMMVLIIGGPGGPRFAAAVLICWLAVAAALAHPVVERWVLRHLLGWRDPDPREFPVLDELRRRVQEWVDVDTWSFDWWVGRSGTVGASAAGRRGIAVGEGLLAALAAGTVHPAEGAAALVHEVGHHVTGSTRFGLAITWLSAPWRMLFRGVLWIARRSPGGRIGMALGPVVVLIAIIQVSTSTEDVRAEHRALVLGLLGVMFLATWVCPLADAALGRATERAADDFARGAGAGLPLASMLERLDVGHCGGWWASHPPTDRRVARLRQFPPAR